MMKKYLKSKKILALLFLISLPGCATLGKQHCQIQAPILNPVETPQGILISDNDIASLMIYIELLEKCVKQQ